MTVSNSDRRASPRIDAKIEVSFQSGAEFVRCYTKNLSQGGLYIETAVLPDPNALIDVVLKLTRDLVGEDREVHVKARIVRLMTVVADRKYVHKVGLQFVDLEESTQNEINALYQKLAS